MAVKIDPLDPYQSQIDMFEQYLAEDLASGEVGTLAGLRARGTLAEEGASASLLTQALSLGQGASVSGLPDVQNGRHTVGVSNIIGGGNSPSGGGDMSNGTEVDLYGRSGVVMNGGGVPVGGPGVPEPPAEMVASHWSVEVHSNAAGTFNLWFFKLVDGRMMCFNPAKNTWKMWRPKKPLAVMYRGKTSLSQAVKVQKYLDGMWKTVAKKTKALKLA